MIQNTYIPLNSKSKIRIDASNTIQYTLLLNYNTPTLNDDESKFVNSLMDKCHECCRGLFSNTKQTSYYYFLDILAKYYHFRYILLTMNRCQMT